jgi:hypothetical protein
LDFVYIRPSVGHSPPPQSDALGSKILSVVFNTKQQVINYPIQAVLFVLWGDAKKGISGLGSKNRSGTHYDADDFFSVPNKKRDTLPHRSPISDIMITSDF